MRILARLISVLLLLVAVQAHAQEVSEEDIPLQGTKYVYSLGMDVSNQIMHPVNDFVMTAFNYRHGMALYAAYRMIGPLGFELGYHWTTDHAKNITTVPGTEIFGAVALTTAEYQCKLRVENYYLDAYWHRKIKKIAELKLGIGMGFQRQNLRFYNPGSVVDPVWQALYDLDTGTTLTARFNIGVQTMFTKQIGGRVLFGYETTSTITARDCLPGVDPHMFANSYTVSIGVFYNVTGYYDD